VCEPLGHLCDLLLLLFNELLEVGDLLAPVVGRNAASVAVVAPWAACDEVRRLPEQVRRLRARHQVMDGRRIAGAARAFELADVAVVGEHGFAEPLPAGRRVAAVAHLVTTVAAATRRRGRRARRARPRLLRSARAAARGAGRRSRPRFCSRYVSPPLPPVRGGSSSLTTTAVALPRARRLRG
jgi:hypothetical protein